MENKDIPDYSNPEPDNTPKNVDTPYTETEATKKKTGGFFKRYPSVLIFIIALFIIVGVYFWKDMQIVKQKAAIEEQATAQMEQTFQDMLKLMSKPLIWSVRSEMLRGNLEQVNIFTADLVKEKNFQYIHVIDMDGKIIISTDKKQEGQSALSTFDNRILQTDSVQVYKIDADMLTLVAPVMGYDKRLATIILKYKPDKFVVENNMKNQN